MAGGRTEKDGQFQVVGSACTVLAHCGAHCGGAMRVRPAVCVPYVGNIVVVHSLLQIVREFLRVVRYGYYGIVDGKFRDLDATDPF